MHFFGTFRIFTHRSYLDTEIHVYAEDWIKAVDMLLEYEEECGELIRVTTETP